MVTFTVTNSGVSFTISTLGAAITLGALGSLVPMSTDIYTRTLTINGTTIHILTTD